MNTQNETKKMYWKNTSQKIDLDTIRTLTCDFPHIYYSSHASTMPLTTRLHSELVIKGCFLH